MSITQQLTEEVFGGAGVAIRAEHEIQGVAGGIDDPVEVSPLTPHLDVRFIHSPGIVGLFEFWADALFEFGSVALDPTVDGGVVDMQTALSHHFFEVAVAE